jgi:hypothetical protein
LGEGGTFFFWAADPLAAENVRGSNTRTTGMRAISNRFDRVFAKVKGNRIATEWSSIIADAEDDMENAATAIGGIPLITKELQLSRISAAIRELLLASRDYRYARDERR